MPDATYLPAAPSLDILPIDDGEAVVLPFSRALLGRGARYADLPSPDGSPVYLPGDPRVESPTSVTE
jgi:hypothetical protein